MKYYSTNQQERNVSLEEAVVKGLAADKGLYMPDVIKSLPASFYDHIEDLSFQKIACRVADAFFGEDVPADTSTHRWCPCQTTSIRWSFSMALRWLSRM